MSPKNDDTMINSQNTEQTTPMEDDNISQFFNSNPEENLDETTEENQKNSENQTTAQPIENTAEYTENDIEEYNHEEHVS